MIFQGKGIIHVIPFFYCLLLLSGCNAPAPVNRAFYHWKQQYNPTAFEKERIGSLHISKIYIKLFDVKTKDARIYPESKLQVIQPLPPAAEIIPVIYITNETLLLTSVAGVDSLQHNIAKLSKEITRKFDIKFRELQVDCDWNESTREKYFKLLQGLRVSLRPEILSATIRLHQVKYPAITGVPPVDKGMLMFYNMGRLSDPAEPNSIYSAVTAEDYLAGLKNYSLPLDAALPAFGWAVHMRHGRVIGLETQTDFPDSLVIRKNNYLFIRKNFFRNNTAFVRGDVVRLEIINPADLKSSASQLHNHLEKDNLTVALFHLDSLQQSRYTITDLEKVYSVF